TVKGVCFSPDGKLLASAGLDHTAEVRDALTGNLTLTLKGHASYVWCLAFSPDGKLLATGSGNQSSQAVDNTARVWELATGKEIRKLAFAKPVQSVAFSPDGKHLLTAAASLMPQVWDVQTGKEVRSLASHSQNVVCAAYGPGGRTVVSVDEGN